MNRLSLKCIVVAVVVTLGFPAVGWSQPPQETVVLTPVADTTLNASPLAVDNNMGGFFRLLAGIDGFGDHRRALLRYDIASTVPELATIDSATLRLVVPDGNIANPSNFALHRLLVDWGEGSGDGMFGEPAAVGDATWNMRMHNIESWGAGGGLAGVDFVSAASSTTFVSGMGAYEWTGLAADVQLWLDNPGMDFGWMFMTQTTASQSGRRFGSREAGGALVPELTIVFTPIPEPTAWGLASAGLLFLVGLRRRQRVV